jgi:two-component system, cell cycle sensor histidine kinase and response regulator CckA
LPCPFGMVLAIWLRDVINRKPMILTVDDDITILNVLQRFLASCGYAVLIASDADEALESYLGHKEEIDAVLLDLNLAKDRGYDLFAKMKEANPAVKVIVTSGYLDPPLERRLLKAGVERTVHKPYELAELRKILRNVIEG